MAFSAKIASAFGVMLHCAEGLQPVAAPRRSDPWGIFYTRPVPDSIDDIIGSQTDDPGFYWLVAATHDGGPFHNIYFPGNWSSRTAMCNVRNMHEELGGRQCMHWQFEDHYDAPWFHACFGPKHYWEDSTADALRATALRRAEFAAASKGGRQHRAISLAQQAKAVRANGAVAHTPRQWSRRLWKGTCNGSSVILNMLDLPDSKGLEVLYQGGPDFQDSCMEDVRAVVQQLGLSSWPLSRCNMDRQRPAKDFPWPQQPLAKP
eukprot:CAMPEP_0171175494 /NCGR_PEP_ID=MMETSP0790-20130122/11257_1 /TAXON_ID=2925 /ORGANISM="Alexandrium catenella, Strain OF101" /LENGTH=261 /DNA_ID=CAMNT_0011640371 /DNA_START=45 /DNA_END=830 /DNA_ORIENTATION=-